MEAEKNALVARAQNGDTAAFGELYALYSTDLYRFALGMLHNPDDAEDAVQNASLRVFGSLSRLKKPEAFKSYYFKTLSNCCKTVLSAKSRTALLPADESLATDDMPFDPDLSASLSSALETLSETDRSIVLLSAVGGFRSAEIAAATGLTAVHVRVRLSRALQKLRKEWEK